jgi:hypothetical protein
MSASDSKEQPSVINQGQGWRVILTHGVPVFEAHNDYQLFGTRGNQLMGSQCPPDKINSTAAGSIPRIMMLKLATTGSTWIGDILEGLKGVEFHAELITGSMGAHMTDTKKEAVMYNALRGPCKGSAVCGTLPYF